MLCQATHVTAPTGSGAVTATGALTFRDPRTGFSTTDLHDAQEQVVHVSGADELVWTPTGTRLPGYSVVHLPSPGAATLISGTIDGCTETCWLEVRFGAMNGTPRAYLTIDYGHYNLGTLADLEVVAGRLMVTQTTTFPPGTFTITGRVTEATPNGLRPLEGATVSRAMTTGWQDAITGSDGVYSLHGQWNGTSAWFVSKAGYLPHSGDVTVNGDTRIDVTLVPQ